MTDTKRPLGPGYWKLWTASVVSNLGDGLSIVAYPWLASALTRNPVAIAGIAVATRLPWLVFTLPAGLITLITAVFFTRETAFRPLEGTR